jgi:SAM-dependent methyltransferase
MRYQISCPVCGSRDFRPLVGQSAVRRENEVRRAFVMDKFRYKPSQPELMDLTRFMHGGPGVLGQCLQCGVSVRIERGDADYSNDRYDHDLLSALYPRYRNAFNVREPHYKRLLRHRAEVVEVGSHLGAFLEVAEQWDWRPTGLDVGIDTSSFARRKGLRVHRSTLDDASLKAHSVDALFVWNCFEQLDDPKEFLRQAHAFLKAWGTLVVRVPNYAFYSKRRNSADDKDLLSLGFNNLLGFPYKLGHTPASLVSLLRKNGFEVLWGRDSNLLAYPLPEWTPSARRQYCSVRSSESLEGPIPVDTVAGPWIEIVARRNAAS